MTTVWIHGMLLAFGFFFGIWAEDIAQYIKAKDRLGVVIFLFLIIFGVVFWPLVLVAILLFITKTRLEKA